MGHPLRPPPPSALGLEPYGQAITTPPGDGTAQELHTNTYACWSARFTPGTGVFKAGAGFMNGREHARPRPNPAKRLEGCCTGPVPMPGLVAGEPAIHELLQRAPGLRPARSPDHAAGDDDARVGGATPIARNRGSSA